MNQNVPDILAAALSLSDGDRAVIAYELLGSLKPPSLLSDADPAAPEELDRRVDEFEAGRSHAAEWDDVDQRLQEALRKRRTP